ncbi:Protein kinase family protein [Zostera marina]|uniref:Protein kinase family protein n=1 Tax=Zostera marina TaxID=29655 RepID=A0A0K9NIK8_ZOSMR|nr:Protein kinase family protein [Zostera marina]
MEQFRQLGEVLGSLQSLMVFEDDIKINRQQCTFLYENLRRAFDIVSVEIRENLRFNEPPRKWSALELPLKELVGVFQGGEHYIKQCIVETNWWAKAISLGHSADVADEHLYRLVSCLPVVLEAVEQSMEEADGRKKVLLSKKYDRGWLDRKLFEVRFGKQYLGLPEIDNRMEMVVKEDRWALMEMVSEKGYHGIKMSSSKHDHWLAKIVTGPRGKLYPISILVASSDYKLKRRIGEGSHFKEIQWLGDTFVARHFFQDIGPLIPEIELLALLSHPNVIQLFAIFSDDERKECFLLTEAMVGDLSNYVKTTATVTHPRKLQPFSLLLAVDIMVQISRGMEYLHSKNIRHGNLNPSTVLVRPTVDENHLLVKITGFGFSSVGISRHNTNQCIWSAPEIVPQDGSTEKADVYSFGMLCFELLTGKVPFDDSHLKGDDDKIIRNIRAGERPLFPFPLPKYLTCLTKKCWQNDPKDRPDFTTISRVLRYIKRFLLLNPGHSHPNAPVPSVDYFDVDNSLCCQFPLWGFKDSGSGSGVAGTSHIPFQMFAYKVVEMEKMNGADDRLVCSDSGGDLNAVSDNINNHLNLISAARSPSTSPPPQPILEASNSESESKSLSKSESESKSMAISKSESKKSLGAKGTLVSKPLGSDHGNYNKQKKWPSRLKASPQLGSLNRRSRWKSEDNIPNLASMSPDGRTRQSGNSSDSELSQRRR